MGASQVVRNPRTYLVDKVRMYRAILFDPRRFYREWAGSRGISREVVLIALIGLVGVIGTYFAMDTLLAPFGEIQGESIPDDVEVGMYQHAAWPLVNAFLLWIAFTAVVYAGSWLYSTVGSFYLLAKYCAWAMLPMLFAFLIRTAAYLATMWSMSPEDVDTNLTAEGTVTDAQIAYLWEQAYADPIVMAAYLAAIPFAIWTAYIAAPGVAKVRDLDMDEAYRVVAAPVVLYAIFLAYEVATTL